MRAVLSSDKPLDLSAVSKRSNNSAVALSTDDPAVASPVISRNSRPSHVKILVSIVAVTYRNTITETKPIYVQPINFFNEMDRSLVLASGICHFERSEKSLP